MAKGSRLNSLTIQKVTKPGLVGDGNGLYLQITETGSKSWVFRYMINGRSRMMGLGSLELVSLSEARIKALECKKLLLEGQDPIEKRDTDQDKILLAKAKTITFDECSFQYIEGHKASWRNAKHAQQWTNTLKTYASPVIGQLPIQDVDTNLIMKVLTPIWHTKTETATRVRSRLELVLAWATVRGYRTGENPATWRNHLDKLFPNRSRVQKVKHFTALSFDQISEFLEKLHSRTGSAAKALEFLILTATRTSEALKAEWSEINFDEKLWIIPKDRMKAGVEHRVPLSGRAIEILFEMKNTSEGKYIFPGARRGMHLSNTALLSVLKKMGYEITAHGFRSTFRDWAAERTTFPREVCEQALAHALKDKVESAYRRGDLLLKRRLLMEQWSQYCQAPPKSDATVIEMPSIQKESQVVQL